MTPAACRWLGPLCLSAAIAFPATLLAQEVPDTGDRILSDPLYLPHQGHFYLNAAYDYESVSATSIDPARALTESSTSSDDILGASVSYGVTDLLSVSVEEGYAFESERAASAGVDQLTRYARGLEDPTFSATYRVLRPSIYPVSLDLSAAWSPSIFSARSSTPTVEGTVARGGGVYDLYLAVGRVTSIATIQGIFEASYVGRDTITGSDGETSTGSGYWQPEIGIASQTRFSDRVSVNLEAAYEFATQFDETESPDAIASVAHRGAFGQVYARLNYHFIVNRLVGSLEYIHGFYGDSREIYPDDPEDNSVIQRSGNAAGVRLWYAFR